MSQKAKPGDRRMNPLLSAALRIFGFTAVFGFLGLVFAPVLMSDNVVLRSILNAAMLAGAGMLFFQMGASKGEDDCKSDYTHAKSKRLSPGALDLPRVYSRPRTALGTLLGTAPWLIIGVVVSIGAVPYAYTLQDLPNWLGAYMRQPDVGKALVYYTRDIVTPLVDWLRIGVRFSILPFVYLIASNGDAASLMLDRIGPLLMLILPACYVAGYLLGPSRFEKTRAFIESVKNKPRMRLKKKARERRQRKEERNQLI
ncbi:hypothetical protein AGMMS49992_09550 [Clostridia bacterium]|nr:hypothetical protein AGMMS49992_09550 [Clostridia bacterium]